MYTKTTNDHTCIEIKYCLDETGCILNEKMMPDVTIMVPELEIVKFYKQSPINI
jgi:hypothetical protein